ncbi:MAG: DedA family protein [Roseiflexaceae bacterium]|nr:DedA family protein [Roseiflexaceae bacterium]
MDDPTIPPPLATAPAETPPKAAIPWKSVLLIGVTIALTIGLAFVPGDLIKQMGNYGYLGLFVVQLLASATLVLPSPTLGFAYLAGKVLDPWLVGLISGVAAGLGEITGYLVGVGGSEFAQRNRYYPIIERYVRRWGIMTIFVLALIPSPVFDLAGIAAGTMRMPFWRFLLACSLGKTIRFIAVAWLGRLAPELTFFQ